MEAVRRHFRPEFINRIDEIIVFHRLRREDMSKIVDIQLGRLRKLLEDRKITIELDDAARTWLANKGYDPVYGARPLKRVIQKHVQDPLSEANPARYGAGRKLSEALGRRWRSDHQRHPREGGGLVLGL